ncbi:MAG: T9SS type A sorting domain-containing protein [Chitinophagales bacterium]
MRSLLCFLLFTAFAINSRAQIQLQNPSMEGTPCLGYCYPNEWTYCETLCGVLDSSVTVLADKKPANPVDGIAYVFLENQPPLDVGSLAQYLQCPLKNGHTYLFQLHDATCWSDSANSEAFGYLQIYGGSDSCDRHQLLWQSELLDTVWKHETITFTPNQNYSWFILWPQYDSIPFVDIAVDALSPIYLVNANEAHITNSDTTLNLGECIYAQAQTNITTYDSLYWINTNTGASFANGQWNTLLCPDSSITYLIAMRDSVPDCAGYKWSYDTLNITVLDTATGIKPSVQNHPSFSIYPNPAKDVVLLKCSSAAGEHLLLQVYNALGQLVYRDRVIGAQQLNVATWPAGVYSFTVLQNGAPFSTSRFLKE